MEANVKRTYELRAVLSHAELAELWRACIDRGPELNQIRLAIESAAGRESVAAWLSR